MKAILWLFLTVMYAGSLQAEEAAGNIGNMSGALVAQRPDGTIRVLAPKSEVRAGDTLATSKDGYAQVNLKDGAKVTLRPDSNLRIDAYHFSRDAPKDDSAIFSLIKGGFRSLTGLISKRGNPDAYRVHTPNATIGVRGTDFSTRLCSGNECSDGGKLAQAAIPKVTAQVVGRIMLLQGELTGKDAFGKERKLFLGSPVYEGDALTSGGKSHAIVAFRDESRITLQEATTFYVEKFKYDKAASEESAVVRLLKGSARVVTGWIGRVNHDNYNFKVANATIGVRGTGFDAWCNGACALASGNPGATQENPLDGAGVYVWAGAVVLITPNGSFNVAIQQAAIIARDTGKPVRVLVVPAAILKNAAPRPDSVPVDVDKEFGVKASSGQAGVYVTVHDGQVIVSQDGKQLSLGKGETGFASKLELSRLMAPPASLSRDIEIDSKGGQFNKPGSGIGTNGCVIR